jgi:hypothetical protein
MGGNDQSFYPVATLTKNGTHDLQQSTEPGEGAITTLTIN